MAARRITSSPEAATSAAIAWEGPTISRDRREWLETDGLGGFASGTISLARTRRYHALLLSAMRPPVERRLLVNGFEAWLTTPSGRYALSSQRYAPDSTFPDGASRLKSFTTDPWPTWTFECEDGTRIASELFMRSGLPVTALSWKLLSAAPDAGPVALEIRPLISVRDPHALHHENRSFDFAAAVTERPASGESKGNGNGKAAHGPGEHVSGPATLVAWRPYASEPEILALTNGRYAHAPEWYRQFLYEAERARGLECIEDLAAPGSFHFDLSAGEAVCLLAAGTDETHELFAQASGPHDAHGLIGKWRGAEKRRRRFADRLERAADTFIVKRGRGRSLIAGYPWFCDWGRDTFIALRGLCLATGRIEDARRILIQWCGAIADGLVPNRFPDRDEAPEYNAVDAALWFVVAVHHFLEAAGARDKRVGAADRLRLRSAVAAVLEAYLRGTRFGIRVDKDGLLAAGEKGTQLTWMDARAGGREVTPRIGKPVEVQALWINALLIGASISARWADPARRAREAFEQRFWNEERGCLYDVIDVNHVRGEVDARLRPNQLFAVGGLPFAALKGDRARRVVDVCEAKLWTPLGCRTLAPGEPGYAPRYGGTPIERDTAYHQGTVWPWLAGPFIEAWVRVRGSSAEAMREARERFLEPLLAHLDDAGLGTLPELADAEPPHAAGGCPFQAWSVGEALRLDRLVLGAAAAAPRTRRAITAKGPRRLRR